MEREHEVRSGAPGRDFVPATGTGDPREDFGWDGVFVWEAGYGVDAWSLLAAMAVRTGRVMLGTLLTPLPWRRPWKVASQVATLDQLSGGRAILTVGLGAISTICRSPARSSTCRCVPSTSTRAST